MPWRGLCPQCAWSKGVGKRQGSFSGGFRRFVCKLGSLNASPSCCTDRAEVLRPLAQPPLGWCPTSPQGQGTAAGSTPTAARSSRASPWCCLPPARPREGLAKEKHQKLCGFIALYKREATKGAQEGSAPSLAPLHAPCGTACSIILRQALIALCLHPPHKKMGKTVYPFVPPLKYSGSDFVLLVFSHWARHSGHYTLMH